METRDRERERKRFPDEEDDDQEDESTAVPAPAAASNGTRGRVLRAPAHQGHGCRHDPLPLSLHAVATRCFKA